MKPLISVIIPAYNAEAYIGKCVDSVRSQTLREIEMVLVDDGSTDSTPALIDGYADADDRVKAVHTPNRTTPYARQTGVDAATGEYLFFMDSDDFLPSDALEVLFRSAKHEGAEIANGNYYISTYNGSPDFAVVRRKHAGSTGTDALRQALLGESGFALWARLISRELYVQTISAPHKYYLGDDGVVLIQLFNRAEKVIQVECPVYYYVLRDGSLSQYSARWSADYARMYFYQFRVNAENIRKNPVIAQERDTVDFFYLYFWSNFRSKSGVDAPPEDQDIREYVFGTAYQNRRARKRLKHKSKKLWIYLRAERNPFWRLVKNAVWGSAFSRRTVSRLRKNWIKQTSK